MLTDLQYVKIVRFLECVKIVHGNEFLISTLRRHKRLYYALQDYEKTHIIDLESDFNLIDKD